MSTLRILRALLIAMLAISAHAGFSASAAEIGTEMPLSLQPGMPPEGAWSVVDRELRPAPHVINNLVSDSLEDALYRMIERGEARTRVEAFAKLLRTYVYWGYFDLDGDGVNEMLVWPGIPGFCGTAGCPSFILKRDISEWRIIDGFYLEEPLQSLCYTRTGPDSYPMIRSERIAIWWSGNASSSICYRACEGWAILIAFRRKNSRTRRQQSSMCAMSCRSVPGVGLNKLIDCAPPANEFLHAPMSLTGR
jgi:hypothetical protein